MTNYSIKNLRILLVDDNIHMHSLLGAILGAFGCEEIMQSTDPEEAFELLPDYRPDIIFADLVMQPIDGIEFIRRIRQHPLSPNPYVPVIMLTGHASSDRVTLARDVGANEFLVKPVSAEAIISRLDAVIRHPRPFVRTETFFGPDRRRTTQSTYTGKERRDMGVFEIDDVHQFA